MCCYCTICRNRQNVRRRGGLSLVVTGTGVRCARIPRPYAYASTPWRGGRTVIVPAATDRGVNDSGPRTGTVDDRRSAKNRAPRRFPVPSPTRSVDGGRRWTPRRPWTGPPRAVSTRVLRYTHHAVHDQLSRTSGPYRQIRFYNTISAGLRLSLPLRTNPYNKTAHLRHLAPPPHTHVARRALLRLLSSIRHNTFL